MQGVSYYSWAVESQAVTLNFSCNMQFLDFCDFKVSHASLTKLNEAVNLHIPLMKLVLHAQPTLCQEYSSFQNAGDILHLASYGYNCTVLIAIKLWIFLQTLDSGSLLMLQESSSSDCGPFL